MKYKENNKIEDRKKKEMIEVNQFFNQLNSCLEKYGENHGQKEVFIQMLGTNNFYKFSDNKMLFFINKLFTYYPCLDFEIANYFYSYIVSSSNKIKMYFLKKYAQYNNILALTYNGYWTMEDYDLLKKCADDIINDTTCVNLLQFRNEYKDNKDITKKIDNKVDELKPVDFFSLIGDVHNIFEPNIRYLNESDSKKLKDYYKFIYLVIKDICRNEEISLKDIEVIGSGSFSSVLGIGNKVLKIGSARITERFPNNPYVTPMLLRKKFIINDDISLFVEVAERCDVSYRISDKEKTAFLKKVNKLGLSWYDGRKDNIGRVSNENGNKINWKENLYVTDEILGLDPYIGEDIVLQKGDLVILDNDSIYDDREESSVLSKIKKRIF